MEPEGTVNLEVGDTLCEISQFCWPQQGAWEHGVLTGVCPPLLA